MPKIKFEEKHTKATFSLCRVASPEGERWQVDVTYSDGLIAQFYANFDGAATWEVTNPDGVRISQIPYSDLAQVLIHLEMLPLISSHDVETAKVQPATPPTRYSREKWLETSNAKQAYAMWVKDQMLLAATDNFEKSVTALRAIRREEEKAAALMYQSLKYGTDE